MTIDKIKKIADFFYSSNEVDDIPLRLSVITGGYSGFDLSRDAFIELLTILNNSDNLKGDLEKFVDKYNG